MSRAVSTFGRVRKPQRSEQTQTKNLEGFPAWDRPVAEQYVQNLVTNTFGDTFYADKKDLVDLSKEIHTKMLAADPQFAAKALVYARQKGYMRTQPLYGLMRLWETNPELAEGIFDKVVRTPNDLRDFVVMLHANRRAAGKSSIGGRRAKRMIGNWLLHLDEYRAIKYGSSAKVGYSLRDLLRIAHPAAGKRTPLLDWIMGPRKMMVGGKMVGGKMVGGESVSYVPPVADLESMPQIRAYEAFKAATTDEDRAKFIVEGRLPHEVATSFAKNSPVIWNAIVRQLPIFALLRNLATLERHDVLKTHRDWIVERLTDEKTIRKSMILPFRFVEARKHVMDGRVQDALRDAVDIAFANVPEVKGRTAVFLDRSGSMTEYMTVATLFAVCLMRKANLDGRVMLFDDQLEEMTVSKRDSLLTQAEKVHERGGTCTSLPMEKLLKDLDKVDNIILITDEQENLALRRQHYVGYGLRNRSTDRTFIDVLDEYKKKVNRNVNLFFVCVAPYSEASLVPTTDPRTFYSYGWSDNTLRFVSMASQGWGGMVEAIRTGKLDEADAAAEAAEAASEEPAASE
jgi:60 kDa SS-A/Ro ribonucleoprotein